MPLNSHSGVGLFRMTLPTDPLPYKISFLLSQTDIKKTPALLYHELHSSFINISCFSPKQNTALSKMLLWLKALNASGVYVFMESLCMRRSPSVHLIPHHTFREPANHFWHPPYWKEHINTLQALLGVKLNEELQKFNGLGKRMAVWRADEGIK